VSAPKEDISASARRPADESCPWRGAVGLLAVPGCRAWVIVLMYVTVGAKWSTDKVQFHGYSVVRSGAGAPAPARPGGRPAAPVAARGRAPRRDQERPAAGRRAAAVIARARPRAWRFRGLVQECYNQLLAEGYLTSRVGSATRVAPVARPAPPRLRPGRSRAAADRRLPVRRAGPGELPARGLDVGHQGGLPSRHHTGSRLR